MMLNFGQKSYFLKVILFVFICLIFYSWIKDEAVAAEKTGVIVLAKPGKIWLRWTLPSVENYHRFPEKGFKIYRRERNDEDENWSSWNVKKRVTLPTPYSEDIDGLIREEFYKSQKDEELVHDLYDTLSLFIDAYNENSSLGNPEDDDYIEFNNALDILLMMSLDRRIAKILGLFCEDTEVSPTRIYQYMVKGIYTKEVKHRIATETGIVEWTTIENDEYIYKDSEPVKPDHETPLVRMTRKPYLRLYPRDVGLAGTSRSDIFGLLEPRGLAASQPAIAVWWRIDFPKFEEYEIPYVTYNIFRKREGMISWEGPVNEYPILIPSVLKKVPTHLRAGIESSASSAYEEPGGMWKVPDIFFLDRPKDENENILYGEYWYSITGIDIFGRESEKSDAEWIDFIDFIPPPPPDSIVVDSTQILPDSKADIFLTWKWGKKLRNQAPDAESFRIFRKENSPDLKKNIPIYEDDEWQFLEEIAVSPNLADSMYHFRNRVEIAENSGDSLVYCFYRIVTGDNWEPSNLSIPSPYVFGYVVDNIPPEPWRPQYDRSRTKSPDWKGMAHVYLYWERPIDVPEDKSLDGFNLYRAIDVDLMDGEGNIDYQNSERDTAYQLINKEIIKEYWYIDQVEACATNSFFYKIRSVDKAGNLGDFSAASDPVLLPDVTPPSIPHITSAVGGDNMNKIKWQPALEEDLCNYIIFRANDDDTDTLDVLSVMGTLCHSIEDRTVIANKIYYYRIASLDVADNLSEKSYPIGVKCYDATSPEKPSLEAFWSDGEITIEVILPEENLRLGIWRKIGEFGPWGMIRPLMGPINALSTITSDETVAQDLDYWYRVQVYDLAGNKSVFSDPVKVDAIE